MKRSPSRKCPSGTTAIRKRRSRYRLCCDCMAKTLRPHGQAGGTTSNSKTNQEALTMTRRRERIIRHVEDNSKQSSGRGEELLLNGRLLHRRPGTLWYLARRGGPPARPRRRDQ